MKKNHRKHHKSDLRLYKSREGCIYPNAADKHYFLEKALDFALTAATGIGTMTIIFFFIVLG